MNTDEKRQKGLALLAMFSPSQVECIATATASYGRGLALEVEKHQVALNYPNNPLGFVDPRELDIDVMGPILRAVGLVLRDALKSNWTESELADATIQGTGVSEDAAMAMAKDVIVNDDAGITRFIMQSQILENFTFGLLPAAAKMIDDAVDYINNTSSENNLYMFYRWGKAANELFLRGRLKALEARGEMEGLAKVDVDQLQELRHNLIPGTLRDLARIGVGVRQAMLTGETESGEPYSDEDAHQSLRAISDAIEGGLRLLARKPDSPPEQAGWLGDALSFVGKAGKGIISGIGKAFSGGGSSKSSSPTQTYPSGVLLQKASQGLGRRRNRRPRRVSDLEVVISAG